MKILIVEDDEWFADSLRNSMLASMSHDTVIEICNSAETAIRIIDVFCPDVLILDVALGAKNGLVLLNELQSYTDTRIIPTIILSLHATQINKDDLAQFGVYRILDKSKATNEEIIESCQLAATESSPHG